MGRVYNFSAGQIHASRVGVEQGCRRDAGL